MFHLPINSNSVNIPMINILLLILYTICNKASPLLSISDPQLLVLICVCVSVCGCPHRDRHDSQLCRQQLLQLDHLAMVHL